MSFVCAVPHQEHVPLTRQVLHCRWMVTQLTVAGAWRASHGMDTLSPQTNLLYWRRTWMTMRLGLQVITTILHVVLSEILWCNYHFVLKLILKMKISSFPLQYVKNATQNKIVKIFVILKSSVWIKLALLVCCCLTNQFKTLKRANKINLFG